MRFFLQYKATTGETRTTFSDENVDRNEHEDHEDREDNDDDDNHDDEDEENKCEDKASHCPELSARGDCSTNKPTMEYYCPKSCQFC